jgi:hypothetical protein
MNYIVSLTYFDDKDLKVSVEEKNLKRFFDDLNNDEIYFNQESGCGFWTCLQNIRHIVVYKQPDEPKISKV